MFFHCVRMRRKVLLWNDQQVNRCLRVDVWEGETEIILVDALYRYRSSHDLTEEAISGHAGILTVPSLANA